MSDGSFDADVRQLVTMRARGRCEVCGGGAGEFHHRRPRGSGGTSNPAIGLASNCLLLCDVDHRRIESNRQWARGRGYLVSQWAEPCEVPVYLRRRGWVLLDMYGNATRHDQTA